MDTKIFNKLNQIKKEIDFHDNKYHSEDNPEISDFEYFYNPYNDILNVNSTEILRNIQLYNVLGQKIIDENINGYEYQKNLDNLSTSIYFVRVQGETGVNTFKLRIR